ncbi:MAG: hypothetical protein ACFE9R_05655, partial [Candidatus Hermodarchaeota archaeon]
MNSHLKAKAVILIIIGVVFSLFLLNPYNPTDNTGFKGVSKESHENSNFEENDLKLSENSGRIHINNNWSDAKTAGIVTGFGTYSDPYVIEDFVINGSYSGFCIWIENSNHYLRIENCSVFNSGSLSGEYWIWSQGIENWWLGGGGIVLSNVSNTLITNNVNALKGGYVYHLLTAIKTSEAGGGARARPSGRGDRYRGAGHPPPRL